MIVTRILTLKPEVTAEASAGLRRSAFRMKALNAICWLWLLVASQCLAADNYRDYLKTVDGFERWFRIGTFSINDGEKGTEIDLYYTDGNKYPQDLKPNPRMKDYPTFFDLICVWRDSKGAWVHKVILERWPATFLRVKRKLDDKIVIQLEGNWKLTLDINDSPKERERKSKLHEMFNRPFEVVVSFVNGEPNATPPAAPASVKQPPKIQPANGRERQ